MLFTICLLFGYLLQCFYKKAWPFCGSECKQLIGLGVYLVDLRSLTGEAVRLELLWIILTLFFAHKLLSRWSLRAFTLVFCADRMRTWPNNTRQSCFLSWGRLSALTFTGKLVHDTELGLIMLSISANPWWAFDIPKHGWWQCFIISSESTVFYKKQQSKTNIFQCSCGPR